MSRDLSPELANSLPAGGDHYRAYVGPPSRYGALALSQMAILTAFGLDETDQVLDFGCGSLRLGRSLIPFLRRGKYFGIDPNSWLMDDGFKWETGQSLREVKEPVFSTDGTFDCTVFKEKFDFIMAQSIITHAGAENTRALIESAGRALKDDGVLLLSFLKGEDGAELPTAPWTYPQNVAYSPRWLASVCGKDGLVWRELDWYHPGATWAAIVQDERRLPPADFPLGLNGKTAPRWRE